jgi:glycine/D-amino acid oxidase-like deaminating enzyme
VAAEFPERADVVLVGGGIVGAASAYFFGEAGVSVVLLERGAIGGEQSGRNWGFVRQQGRHPLELPLAMESNRIWQTMETELQADLEWTPVATSQSPPIGSGLDQYEQRLGVAREPGLETRLLSAAEVGTSYRNCGGR